MIEQRTIFFSTEDFIILNDPVHLPVVEKSDDKWMRVIVCCEGELSATLDDNPLTLTRNEILFITSDQKLSNISVSHDFKFMVFALTRQMNSEIFPNSAKVWKTFHQIRINSKIKLPDSEIKDLRIDFQYLGNRLPDCRSLFYHDYIRCIIQALVYRISAKILSATGAVDAKDFMPSPESLSEAFFNLLNSTYPTPRTVEWYAVKLNKTPKYLSTVIRRTSGKKPTEWITEKAVNEIANLLKNSNKSVKEISIQLNFSSLSFFCRYVRRYLGVSPNQYRSLKHWNKGEERP